MGGEEESLPLSWQERVTGERTTCLSSFVDKSPFGKVTFLTGSRMWELELQASRSCCTTVLNSSQSHSGVKSRRLFQPALPCVALLSIWKWLQVMIKLLLLQICSAAGTLRSLPPFPLCLPLWFSRGTSNTDFRGGGKEKKTWALVMES